MQTLPQQKQALTDTERQPLTRRIQITVTDKAYRRLRVLKATTEEPIGRLVSSAVESLPQPEVAA